MDFEIVNRYGGGFSGASVQLEMEAAKWLAQRQALQRRSIDIIVTDKDGLIHPVVHLTSTIR